MKNSLNQIHYKKKPEAFIQKIDASVVFYLSNKMVNNIVALFCKQAREHKAIRSFYYNRNYEIGSGNEKHPLLWLEDPISGRNQNNVFSSSVNFSVLFIPDHEHTVDSLQHIAFSIGLNIVERIKADPNSQISVRPNWNYMTLRNYYDNNACGCRFSLELILRNMQDLCLIDEQFDTDKQFEENSILRTTNPENEQPALCEVYTNKLPVFDLKISK